MDKGTEPCLCIAHVCLDRIVPRFVIYVHEYECMSMLWIWLMLWCQLWIFLVSNMFIWKGCSYSYVSKLCMNERKSKHVWSKIVYVKTYMHTYTHENMYIIHVWWSSQYRGLWRCSQVYPKLDGASICYVHVKYFLTWFRLMNSHLWSMS